MSKIKQLKQELKDLTLVIREGKAFYKDCQRGAKNWNDYYAWNRDKKDSRDYRHMHIAYCLLRGRTMEQIENKVRENNSPNMTRVENIMREYREVEEIQCAEVVNV